MSKIAIFLEAQHRHERDNFLRTVAHAESEVLKALEVAFNVTNNRLDNNSEGLLTNVIKESTDVNPNSEGRARLIEALKNSTHRQDMPEEKPSRVEHPSYKSWRAVANQENGAEWECLSEFAECVMSGQSIDASRQSLINLIVAKAVKNNSLPKRFGRPKSARVDEVGKNVSREYFELHDAGVPFGEVMERLSTKFSKDDRQIMRYVNKNRASMGVTREAREANRKFESEMAEFVESIADVCKEEAELKKPIPRPDFETNDFIDHLNELIREKFIAMAPLSQKS